MNQKQGKKGLRFVMLFAGVLFMVSTSVDSRAAVRKPSLSKKKLHMTVGKQDRLSVKNKKGYSVSWKSSKKAVATVSKMGTIKTKKSGTSRITAVVKPDEGGKTYRLVFKVFVKKGKRQVNVGEKAASVKTSEQPVLTELPIKDPAMPEQPTPEPEPPIKDPAMPEQPTPEPEPPIKDPAMPEQPVPGQPADSTTGSAVADGEAKLLFDNYNDGLVNGNFFGNQIVASYEQLQNLIQKTKAEMAGNTWQPGRDQLQWYIDHLEAIGQDYFTDHVLCISTMSVARGYDYTLDMAGKVVEEDGTKALYLCLKRHYNLKKDECVTCDMPYYSFFIQLPRELVQNCESVVCSLVSDGECIPSEDPDDPYMIQDVLRILDQICYPLS